MDVATVAAERSKINIVDSDKVGFNALDAEAFMKLLVAQLQNQDPTNPTSNEDMLAQISQMRSLQSNVELTDTLKNMGTGQQLSSAAGMIGKLIAATNDDGDAVTGLVESVIVSDGTAYLQVGDQGIKLSQVTEVANPG